MNALDVSCWVCTDCLVLFANGETPTELDEEETAAWCAEIDRRTAGYHVACGGEHDEDCPNMTPARVTATMVTSTGEHYITERKWIGNTDCYCEEREFSWSTCDTCGSTLGGSRHAVTLFDS